MTNPETSGLNVGATSAKRVDPRLLGGNKRESSVNVVGEHLPTVNPLGLEVIELL